MMSITCSRTIDFQFSIPGGNFQTHSIRKDINLARIHAIFVQKITHMMYLYMHMLNLIAESTVSQFPHETEQIPIAT